MDEVICLLKREVLEHARSRDPSSIETAWSHRFTQRLTVHVPLFLFPALHPSSTIMYMKSGF